MVQELSVDRVIRADIATVGFLETKSVVLRVTELLNTLRRIRLDCFPPDRLDASASAVHLAITTFHEMANFDPQEGNLKDRRAALIDQCNRAWSEVAAQVIPYLGFSELERVRTFESRLSEEINEKSRAVIKNLEAEYATTQTNLQKLMTDAERTLTAAKEAAADIGITSEAKHFQTEASRHARAAQGWLCAAAIVALGIIMYTLKVLEPHLQQIIKAPNTTAQTILPVTIARLVIVSVLWYALIWTTRNFAASRHNFVINRHRENAISTFRAFVESPRDDQQTRNAILMQAAKCIFDPQQSGYLRTDSDQPAPSGQIIEIFRGVVDGKPRN